MSYVRSAALFITKTPKLKLEIQKLRRANNAEQRTVAENPSNIVCFVCSGTICVRLGCGSFSSLSVFCFKCRAINERIVPTLDILTGQGIVMCGHITPPVEKRWGDSGDMVQRLLSDPDRQEEWKKYNSSSHKV